MSSSRTCFVVLLGCAAVIAGCGQGPSSERPDGSAVSSVDVPSGTIVFRRYLDAQQSQAALFTMTSEGKDETRTTHPPDYAIDGLPDWSPDGKQIAFHREYPDKPNEIFVVSADGTDERQVDPGCPDGIPDDQICEELEPAWSPNGKTLAFAWPFGGLRQVRGEEIIDVMGVGLMGPDGSDPELITQTRRPTRAEDSNPIWSPDGRQIAFVRFNVTAEPHDASAVFVANADGSGEKRITPWNLNAEDPSWSPDGALISFRSETGEGDFIGHLHTIRPDGSEVTRLTKGDGKQVFGSSFSPDSQWIVFAMTGVDGLPDLFVTRQDGTDLTPLTRTPAWESAPDWSPR